jgi:hypothetical protein
MNKEFVSYEQALELKELGFDEPCLGFYNHQGQLILMTQEDENSIEVYKNSYVKLGKQYAVPLYQQAFRWFRDKYDLDIDISRNDQEMIDYVERKGEKYLPKYRYGYSNGIFIPIGTCMKYEEADLACLKKLIEIIKQKNDNNT